MTTTTRGEPVEIVDWWIGSRTTAGKIVFRVRWANGDQDTTIERVDLNLPGDKIARYSGLQAALRTLAGEPALTRAEQEVATLRAAAAIVRAYRPGAGEALAALDETARMILALDEAGARS